MAEKELRKYIKGKLAGHTIQIESHATATGVPDTNNCQDGCENWIELKFGTPKKCWRLRPAQKSWFRRRCRAGASNTWILWRFDDQGDVFHGLIHVNTRNIEKVFCDISFAAWRDLACVVWGRHVDGEKLNRHMTENNHG